MDEVTNDVPEMVPTVEPEVVVEPTVESSDPAVTTEPVVEQPLPELEVVAPVETVLTPDVAAAIMDAVPIAPEPVVAEAGRADMGKVFDRNGIKFVRTTDAQGNVVDIALPTAPAK